MNLSSALAFAAAFCCGALAVAVVWRKRSSIARWSFCAGMLTLGAESVFSAFSSSEAQPGRIAFWQTIVFQVKSLLPSLWLCFSLTFSRGNYLEFLRKSRLTLLGAAFVPVFLAIAFRNVLLEVVPHGSPSVWWVGYSGIAKLLSALLLLGTVVVLMNLERTFRSAVGTMQWRVKYVALGVAVIFGARIYTLSQALIYSGNSLSSSTIETGSLLIGCMFMVVGYLRGGFGEVDIYPSRAALHTSLTVVLAGGYLFVVGVLAQILGRTGGVRSFQFQALLILVAAALLAVLLLSKRLRQTVERFVSRHFKRPEHDFRRIWSRFTNSTGNLQDKTALCATAANLISETFDALSVSIWLLDKREHKLALAASTFESSNSALEIAADFVTPAHAGRPPSTADPFELDKANEGWAAKLRGLDQQEFRKGGSRICVPLRAGEAALGYIVLADRVNGISYTAEEFELLKCIGDQTAASLLNLRLTEEVLVGKELEAFQTISAFFVHDLKNAASTLGLMLQNLPVHFNDPAFREDALRGIGRTADRINQLISSLSLVRQKLAVHPVDLDLNKLIEEALETIVPTPGLEIASELHQLPTVLADREQVQSVITNLLLNARDAVSDNGKVKVATSQRDPWVTVSVTDTGCGMSKKFLQESLFRPFSTTKKKGLGIGMFQTKMIVEAHGGNIQVTSEVGKGTTFEVFLPFKPISR